MDCISARLALGVKQRLLDDNAAEESNRDTQIRAIQHTFECAQKPITEHYSKPNITPVEIMPILPDADVCSPLTPFHHF